MVEHEDIGGCRWAKRPAGSASHDSVRGLDYHPPIRKPGDEAVRVGIMDGKRKIAGGRAGWIIKMQGLSVAVAKIHVGQPTGIGRPVVRPSEGPLIKGVIGVAAMEASDGRVESPSGVAPVVGVEGIWARVGGIAAWVWGEAVDGNVGGSEVDRRVNTSAARRVDFRRKRGLLAASGQKEHAENEPAG